MSAILNVFRYIIGTLLVIVFLTIFFLAGMIAFFALSFYSSAFFSYFIMIMPFRIMTHSFEDARQRSKDTLHGYIKVIHSCVNTFYTLGRFFLVAISPFFKKLNVGYST